jgi:hypothetical protein
MSVENNPKYTDQQPFSPRSNDTEGNEYFDIEKKIQNERLAQEATKRLAQLFTIEDITPSRAYEDTLPSFLFELWHILIQIGNQLPNVQGAMLTMEDVININKETSPFEIEVN